MSDRQEDTGRASPTPWPGDDPRPASPLDVAQAGGAPRSAATPPIGPEPRIRGAWASKDRREMLAWVAAAVLVLLALVVAFRRAPPPPPRELPVPAPGREAPPPLPDEVPPAGRHGPASEPGRPAPGAP